MARPSRITAPDFDELPDGNYDEMSEKEQRQAEIGTLFAVKGPEYENVQWSIFRRRTRQEMSDDPTGGKEEWVHDATGELDGADLVNVIGGGTFRFYGHVPREGGGVQIKYHRVITLAGRRKNFAEPETLRDHGTPPPVPPVVDHVTLLLQQIQQDRREANQRFEQLLLAMRQPTVAAPPSTIVELVTALKGIHDLTAVQGGGKTDSLEVANSLMNAFHQGITLGQEREPLPIGAQSDPNSMLPIIEKGLDIVARFITDRRASAAAAARARAGGAPPRPAGAPSPNPPSEATVVEPEAPAPTTTPDPRAVNRWATAVEAMYRAMVSRRDPADFASSIEDILNAEEIDVLRSITAAEAIAHLQPMLAVFPALMEPQGRVYVTQVLAAVRNLDAEDAEPDPEPTTAP